MPGLGAHPEDSWKSESTGFNWTTEGLVRDFPRARILLYMYESAWTGSLKVKQFMSNIAMTLLNGLRSKREVSKILNVLALFNFRVNPAILGGGTTTSDCVYWS